MTRAETIRTKLARRRRAAADRLHTQTRQALGAYEREVASIDAEEERVAALDGQPEVYVRRPGGPAVETYHTARCGKLPSSPETLYLDEAVARGLRPCWFCTPPTAVAARS